MIGGASLPIIILGRFAAFAQAKMPIIDKNRLSFGFRLTDLIAFRRFLLSLPIIGCLSSVQIRGQPTKTYGFCQTKIDICALLVPETKV